MDSKKQKQKRDLGKDLLFCDFLHYYWAENVFRLNIFLRRKSLKYSQWLMQK